MQRAHRSFDRARGSKTGCAYDLPHVSAVVPIRISKTGDLSTEMLLQQLFGARNFVTCESRRQQIQGWVSMTMCAALDPARADLRQLGPCHHGAHAFVHVLQPTTCVAYERSGNVERRYKVVTLECWKGVRIKIRVAIIEGQEHRARR